MFKNIISSAVVAIVAAVLVCSLFVQGSAPTAGGNFNVVQKAFDGGISVGPGTPTGPSTLSNIILGQVTCTGSSTVSGLSVQNYDCAVPGVLGLSNAGQERVFVTVGSSTAAYGVYVAGAYASTTANGSFRLMLGNASSTPANPSLAKINYLIAR